MEPAATLAEVVPFGWGDTGAIRQIALPETVAPQHPQRLHAPRRRQRKTRPVGPDQPECVEARHQPDRMRARNLERTGEALGRAKGSLVLAVVEVLERVLDPRPLSQPEHPCDARQYASLRPEHQRKRYREKREYGQCKDRVGWGHRASR